MRPELGGVFKIENARFRDIGGKLSAFRDAGAIIETFDNLKKQYEQDWGEDHLASIRRGLMKKKHEAEAAANIEEALPRIAAELDSAGKKVKRWPLKTDGFAAIEPGLKLTFRDGRDAFDKTQTEPRPENYHQWRKRVKDHWYHIRLLEDLWTEVLQAYEKSLKELETWLGEDHNLVVLQDKVSAEAAFYGSDKEIELFIASIEKYRKALRDNAVSLGARIYDEKPRDFTHRMRHLWQASVSHRRHPAVLIGG